MLNNCGFGWFVRRLNKSTLVLKYCVPSDSQLILVSYLLQQKQSIINWCFIIHHWMCRMKMSFASGFYHLLHKAMLLLAEMKIWSVLTWNKNIAPVPCTCLVISLYQHIELWKQYLDWKNCIKLTPPPEENSHWFFQHIVGYLFLSASTLCQVHLCLKMLLNTLRVCLLNTNIIVFNLAKFLMKCISFICRRLTLRDFQFGESAANYHGEWMPNCNSDSAGRRGI